ncbi:MAG: DUF86 domain-containing protein [Candidatus Nanopelagicales bacterium]
MSRTPRERLTDVLEAIRKARAADARLQAADAAGDLEMVEMAFDAVLLDLMVIGESVKALPAEVLDREPDVPWRDVMAMRDRVGHHYHRIVPAIIHASVRRDLGPLEAAVHRLLGSNLPGDETTSRQ